MASSTVLAGAAYPERHEPREGRLDRILTAARFFTGRVRLGAKQLELIVAATNRAALGLDRLSDQELVARAAQLRTRLRREAFGSLDLAAQSFALVREAAARTIGQRHFDVQLIGAWAMLNGMLAEMETGEGKTITATLAAATAALAGRAVHVITVNDYLAERDAQGMAPVYRTLGISVGCVKQGMDPASRRAAYRCGVAYCSNKEIAFDYLRDRMVLGGKPRAIAMRMDALAGAGAGQQLLLRGLQFAIIDEADSVLVDEARTPLILSAEARLTQEEVLHEQALALARRLDDADFELRDTSIEIKERGLDKLEEFCRPLKGVWRGPRRREQLVRQALSALHQFQRDKHYLVRDGKVVIIDENTGRLMPDRSWEQGLHQLIEIKEGCEVTGRRDTLARISYQRFFRRYVHLSGMTGTASEVAAELWAVYRLRVAAIPTNKPVRRLRWPDSIYGGSEGKWRAVVERISQLHEIGRPVLVGTRTVAASEELARLLEQAQVPFRLLNARQDRDEAEIVARAGAPGCVTVATNMAGRGTDILLDAASRDAGGLHVICCQQNASRRIDRQLLGRCARQGDPGSVEIFVALDGPLLRHRHLLKKLFKNKYLCYPYIVERALRQSQRAAERQARREREALMRRDHTIDDWFAFSGGEQ